MENSKASWGKSFKQQQVQTTDRNANSPTTLEEYQQLPQPERNDNVFSFNLNDSFSERPILGRGTQFTELFCDFPVSYETTEVITAAQYAKHNLMMSISPTPTTYNDPPPPTPPPISQLPKRDNRLQHLNNTNISASAPATPSRGKVVLSRKERKELNKLHKLLDRAGTASSSINLNRLETAELLSSNSENNTYRGRVSELKSCISKINSKVLFGSLNRSLNKSTLSNIETAATQEVGMSVNDTSPTPTPPPPAPDASPPKSSSAFNNNDVNYSEKLKNLPVRQRKAHTTHMENYCLFDPVDFINEKAMRKRGPLSAMQQVQALRDPLFSSRQSLQFSDEELVPEIIYDNKEISEAQELQLLNVIEANNFAHHNYFVIDPEELEKETTLEAGLPDKQTNEQYLSAKLKNDDIIQISKSCDDKLAETYEVHLLSKSLSEESKNLNDATRNKTVSTTAALVESSSSAASALTSSSNSAASSQTTLQRTKKKLSFLNLSPFRTQCNNKNCQSDDKKAQEQSEEHKSVERAVSELVSSDHMQHLQQMLFSSKENLRARTVPIESNYVLFNPGPVPSRNVPYKVRKPRPLSTNSDADSGFLSPCSPDEMASLKSNPAILVLQQCDSVQGYIEVRFYFK